MESPRHLIISHSKSEHSKKTRSEARYSPNHTDTKFAMTRSVYNYKNFKSNEFGGFNDFVTYIMTDLEC